MRNFEVKAIVTMVFPEIKAKTKHDAIQEVINKLPTNVEKDGVLKCAIILDDVIADCYDLMDTSNGHDKDLVNQINYAYDNERELFHEIVKLLVERDRDECNFESSEFDMRRICYEYCYNVADNQDLQTICNYCRV